MAISIVVALVGAQQGGLIGAPTSAQALTSPDKFVRTANYYLMSGSALEGETTISTLSKFDLLVLPAEAQVFNRTFFAEARKRNPDILILAYVPSVSWNNIWKDTLHKKLYEGISADFWLTDGSGGKKSIWPGTNALNLNSGWADYLPKFAHEQIMGTGLWDGIFYDEVGESISWTGAVDVDRDGRADDSARADELWRVGYEKILRRSRELEGAGKIIITNGSTYSSYQQYVNGRMFESFPTPWEGNGSWQTVVANYLRLEKIVKAPPIFIINGNTNNTGNQTDYQKVRFGLTSALLGGAYFGFDFGDKGHSQLWRYDEYDANIGAPLGAPEDKISPQNQTIRPSVWEREFTAGKVLVNSTEQTQEVRLDGEYEKLHGAQDPKTNNGAIVSRVTLAPHDGIILLRPIEEINNAVFVNGAFARIFDKTGATKRTGFFAYDNIGRGGTRVIKFDIDNDGKLESVVANDSKVQIYDDDGRAGAGFFPYTENYKLGVNIAVGDLEGDGKVEIVTGTENGGGPHIRIFNKDGGLVNAGFFAYDTKFRGGVNVAIGDINGDNVKEIIAGAGVGGGPHIRVFNKDGKLVNAGFFAYDPKFRGGVNVATGDLDADGKDEIIAGPGRTGGPHVRVFNEKGELKAQFFAFDASGRSGVDVSATDIDNDGKDEIIAFSSEVFTFSFK